jgi:hypothetical protein
VLERLIGDVCNCINDTSGGRLKNELLDLYDQHAAAEKDSDGMLDEPWVSCPYLPGRRLSKKRDGSWRKREIARLPQGHNRP